MDVGSLCSNPRRFESIYPELIIRYGRQAFRVASPYTYELDWQYFPPSAFLSGTCSSSDECSSTRSPMLIMELLEFYALKNWCVK
jgi:hypothetical protein